MSDAVVRSRVVLEIMNTERDYVKNLEDVVEVREELICCVKNLKVHKKWEGDGENLKYGHPPSLCTGTCFAPVVGFPALCFDCIISRA